MKYVTASAISLLRTVAGINVKYASDQVRDSDCQAHILIVSL